MQYFILTFEFADPLSHGSHRAEGTPGPWSVEYHDDKTYQGRSQHETVEPIRELSDPRRDTGNSICPVPRKLESPEQLNNRAQRSTSCKYKIGLIYHISKHCQEKDKKTISEYFAIHPGGSDLPGF